RESTDPKELWKKVRSFMGIGILGTFTPLFLGTLVTWLFTNDFWVSLLIGLAISGTSLATKSLILEDLDLLRTKLGHSMLGGGMVDNILSFIILTLALKTIADGSLELLGITTTLLLVSGFFIGVLFVGYYIYPIIGPTFAKYDESGFVFAFIMGLLVAGIGQLIGLHFIIGAYLAGLFVREEIMPQSPATKEFYGDLGRLDSSFRVLSHGFLGPIFIISVAYKVNFAAARIAPLFLLGLIGAAIAGKVIGAGGGAYISGEHTKIESLTIGVGMNGRGTVELILAAIGLEIGVLTENHLSLLVFTAFITTLMVPIVLRYLVPKLSNLERV
ncbi:MAG: cation:proton antiporter, partial [Hadesarchaea archaeon]|nr:cation:proton antiporter [Hadesarchaea archaeon]